MAHYAFIDNDNVVIEVITGRDEGSDGVDWEQRYSEIRGKTCLRTSYNTRGGVHYMSDGVTPSEDQSRAIRKNYAGIGYTYHADIDAFVPPRPWASWTLDPETALWEPPIPRPSDEGTGDPPILYRWDEDQRNWVIMEMPS